MIKSTLSLLLLFACTAIIAQVCTTPQSQIDLEGNSIRARLLNGGDMFWDLNDAQFIPDPSPNGPDPATIFAAGLWVGGVDPGGNLKLAAVTYRNSGLGDYWAGPLAPQGITTDSDCANWDRHFKVTAAEVAAFLDALPGLAGNPGAAIAQFPGIMGWPALGNPHFSAVWGFDLPFTGQSLAGFFDADNNGSYNPLGGDYPAVVLQGHTPFVPTEIVWCVFNDQGAGAVHSASHAAPLQIEVQLTAWAISAPGNAVVDHTVFTAHKVINRGSENIDSCFIGLFVDFDLGCYSDDYIGCLPDQNTFFCYNQDAVDGSVGPNCDFGVPTFGAEPPVQTVTFLNRSLDRFIYFNNPSVGNYPPATYDPDQPNHYYNYLNGRWLDGSPMTTGSGGYPGSGSVIQFVFPDNPGDPNGWSMCTDNLPYGDRRVVASSRLDAMGPGAVNELITAWTVHRNAPPPCNLGNAPDDVAALQDCFDAGADLATCLTSAVQTPAAAPAVSLFPNPATGILTLRHEGLTPQTIRCHDAAGRLVKTLDKPVADQNTLDVSGLPSGLYTIQVLTRQGSWTVKAAVVR